MAKSGLRKVVKTVRGKHGTHRRAYYVRSASPQPKASLGRRAAGAALGATLGAVGGVLFGGTAGAGLGAVTATRGVRNDLTHGLQTHYGTSQVHTLPAEVRARHAADYLKHNAGAVAGHVGSRAALGGVWGAGAGAAGGAAFGAALGYAAAANLGRGGRRGGLKSQGPSHGLWSPRYTGEYHPLPIQPHERPDSLHNSQAEYERRHRDNQKRSRT